MIHRWIINELVRSVRLVGRIRVMPQCSLEKVLDIVQVALVIVWTMEGLQHLGQLDIAFTLNGMLYWNAHHHLPCSIQ